MKNSDIKYGVDTIILVCNSNMFIPYVLTEVLEHKTMHYLVLSDVENIEYFFKQLSLQNVSFYRYGTYGRFDVIASKKRLMFVYAKYKISKLIFFHAEFGGVINWFIKKISIRIPIYYCKIFDSPHLPKASYIKSLKEKLKQIIYWGMNMDMLKGSVIIPSLPKSFFKNIHAHNITIKINYHIINTELNTVFDSLNIKSSFVLLTGSVVESGSVEISEYIRGIEEIITLLGSNNIVSKCHPRFSKLYGKESSLKQIPSYIPGNLIINRFDVFIGYRSTLLVEAAAAGKLVISLLYYLRPANIEALHNMHSFLNNRLNNRGVIYYPKNISELKKIISQIYAGKNS